MLKQGQEMLIVARVIKDQQRLKEKMVPEMAELPYIMIDKAIRVEAPIIATRGNILNGR
jgi:hypothetical protein